MLESILIDVTSLTCVGLSVLPTLRCAFFDWHSSSALLSMAFIDLFNFSTFFIFIDYILSFYTHIINY